MKKSYQLVTSVVPAEANEPSMRAIFRLLRIAALQGRSCEEKKMRDDAFEERVKDLMYMDEDQLEAMFSSVVFWYDAKHNHTDSEEFYKRLRKALHERHRSYVRSEK